MVYFAFSKEILQSLRRVVRGFLFAHFSFFAFKTKRSGSLEEGGLFLKHWRELMARLK